METEAFPLGSWRRRLYDALLIGIPFGIFKIAAGWTIAALASDIVGWIVVAWGALDVALNVAVLAGGRHAYCLLSTVGRWLEGRGHSRWEERLLALDTFISFGIVSIMIWFRFLPALPPLLGRTWDVAVVGNVMGVGIERLYLSFRRRGT